MRDLKMGPNLEAVRIYMLLAVCVVPQVTSQHYNRPPGLEIAISLVSGDVSNEQTLTTCTDFHFRHVSTLDISSRVRMRSACSCSVQAPSEHYPMSVTMQQSSTDNSDLPRLDLAEHVWRRSSELALTVTDNKVVVDACDLHYEQRLPVTFLFGNEAGALLTCTEVAEESLIPTETKCRDLPTANQPLEKQSADANLPLVLIGAIVGICLVAIVVVNVIITISIKQGCSRRRRASDLTDASHEQQEHVNVISHSVSMDFDRDETRPAEDAVQAQSTTLVPRNTHSNQSPYLEPQNNEYNPCFQTSNTNNVPKRYPQKKTDLDMFVRPVNTTSVPKQDYSYAYDSNDAVANSGIAQPYSPSFTSVSSNAQCNSRVKEMARLLDDKGTITSYDSGYAPDTTGPDQGSMVDQLHRVIQPPCVYGEERQYMNLPCAGLPKI